MTVVENDRDSAAAVAGLDALDTPVERTTWWAGIRLNNGDEVICTVHPIQDGATLVCFRGNRLTEAAGQDDGMLQADAR